MNKRLVAYMQGAVLLIEAACMTQALVIALFLRDLPLRSGHKPTPVE